MKITVIILCIVTTALCVMVGNDWIEDRQERESKARMEARFYSTDSLIRANQMLWQVKEKQEDDAFKDSVRAGHYSTYRAVREQSMFQFDGAKPQTLEGAYLIAISALATVLTAVVGIFFRVIKVLHGITQEDKKTIIRLVEDEITSTKEFTATLNALKPYIKL